MTAPKLALHPVNSTAAPTHARILSVLRDMAFIGTDFDLDGRTHCCTGSAFLDDISFLGCAPSIQLDPPAPPADPYAEARAGRFCHVQLHAASNIPRLRYRPDQGPRCRHCRAVIPTQLLQQPIAAITCVSCACSSPLDGLNWRQAGGYARVFLDIWGIHTAEAVPSDRLLNALAQASDGPWQFFYIDD